VSHEYFPIKPNSATHFAHSNLADCTSANEKFVLVLEGKLGVYSVPCSNKSFVK